MSASCDNAPTMSDKQIAIIYHKRCPDGFGAAYAAWKKFGDTAEYIPAGYGDELPEGLSGKEVYILDFSYESSEAMQELLETTGKLIVLDHHQSSKERVESVPEHVYDATRSGATIAWSYFHPDTPMPRLMTYLEDGDLYHYALAETRDVFSYLALQPDDFLIWDSIAEQLDDETLRPAFLEKAALSTEYFKSFAQLSIEAAKKVMFEGYECYFTTTLPSITMRSYVANELYKKLPPLSLVVTAHPNGFGVSIRSDGTIDVSEIAGKYGGGGHPGSAGFFIPNGETMPWTEVVD
jgi:uncharacterized protein